MTIGDEILRERLNLREQALMQQADSLDVKASILLVAVTFLAGHSMYLLSKPVTAFVRYDQWGSVLLQIVAGVMLALHLRIRTYSGETSEQFRTWRDEVVKTLGTSKPTKVEETLNLGIIDRAIERINEAVKINSSKALWIDGAYWITLIALAANLASTIALLI